jgi:hypothetical protein
MAGQTEQRAMTFEEVDQMNDEDLAETLAALLREKEERRQAEDVVKVKQGRPKKKKQKKT